MRRYYLLRILAIGILFLVLAASAQVVRLGAAVNEDNHSPRRVNVPYWPNGGPYPSHAIFWFGKVDPSNNYADVRLIYDDTHLEVVAHIIDRRLLYDTSPSPTELTQWDAVTLYLNIDGNIGTAPGRNSYRFDGWLNWWEPRDNWQSGYKGDGVAWVASPISFLTETGWRGSGLNDGSDDKGWNVVFTIPFKSLGLSSRPPTGTTWGLAMALYDRDDVGGSSIPYQIWPEQMDPLKPATWGQLHFDQAEYSHPPALLGGTTTIRQGLNGATVVDGHVGGHTTCGDGIDHWTEWGQANYAGYEQINIQNQWDVADYPCFSKYYVTFPLDELPAGKILISASLTMNLFGNAGGDEWGVPSDSYIQVLTVADNWDEATLNWNNGPLAVENISGTWVKPTQTSDQVVYEWDVSKGVASAHAQGEPLRLALYSADGEMHSGKYFWSSDVGDWNVDGRPTLRVIWGETCGPADDGCQVSYLPLTSR